MPRARSYDEEGDVPDPRDDGYFPLFDSQGRITGWTDDIRLTEERSDEAREREEAW